VTLLVSALTWGLLFACFPPEHQDFPLNDDWAFGRGAILFAGGEGIHYGKWASMPQLGQWLWACPFVWLLGPSFFTLRLSTIVLSWFGLWAFYDLLRQQNVAAPRAAFAAAVLALNPLFFLLQGTFMTDVPALSLALGALALYARALRQGHKGWLVCACAVAVLAAITRQNTLAVSATAAMFVWRERSLCRCGKWWLSVLLPAIVGVAVHLWFQQRMDVRALKPVLLPPAPLLLLPFVLLHFAGLAALPLLVLAPRVASWKTFAWALGLMLGFAGYWYLYGVYLPYGGLFPYTDNMLTPHGAFAGSRLSGGLLVAGTRPLVLSLSQRVFLSLLGSVAAAMLVTRIWDRWRSETRFSPLVLFSLCQIPFLLIVEGIYDRYLLFFLPGILFLATPAVTEKMNVGRWPRSVGIASLAVFGILSVALMHDWLSWNAARWQLGRRAVQQRHINPLSIEGGVEWDGWYAAVGGEVSRTGGLRWPVLPFTREWFPSITGRYCLSFSELTGTRRMDAEPYSLWLSPGSRQFYLLEVPPLPAPSREHRIAP
jgi:4-amino-4-deoxy-L-arabinose transferase-like glycosyltransferase